MTDLIGQQFGNYSLKRLLGQGGFADVYLGEHIFLKTPVAIKVLQGRMTPQEIQNFIKEAQTIVLLKHPHIIRVLDFGMEKNIPFLVMDYAPNATLRQRHPHGSRLLLSTALPYLQQIAAALQYAHNQKLVHRDVKPENMLIDADNKILLSDFGIVVIAHRTQSLSAQEAMGTVSYMAPEQIKGMARPASDQYSLGVVLYEWLTGTRLFTGSTSIEIAMKHLSEPPPPFDKNLQISSQVEQVIFNALAKDSGQRFPSVQDFVLALEQAYSPYRPVLPPLANYGATATAPSFTVPQGPNPVSPPTLHAQPPQSPVSPSTNTLSPPMIQKPTEEQLYQTLTSQDNPYAPWGKLILNEDTSKVWKERHHSKRVEKIKYEGEYFIVKLRTYPLDFITHFYQNILKKVDVRDFAYQVHVTFEEGDGEVGLLFRSDRTAETCYGFGVRRVTSYGDQLEARAWVCLSTIDRRPNTTPIDECNEAYPLPKPSSSMKRSFLLAVVAQGITFDFYIDLQHVKRVTSTALSHGTIGLFIDTMGGGATMLFRHTKLWTKQ